MFVLLTVLMSVINVINFTMAADDADHMTEAISRSKGSFSKENDNNEPSQPGMSASQTNRFRFGQFGPESAEMNASLRYFTFSFDDEGKAKKVEFKMSAVSEQEAENWARSLVNQKIGWTNMTYRYRDKTYVTVIDQSRELVPCYRILIISVRGEAAVLVLSLIFLIVVGKHLFKEVEKADRKQKKFIARVESEFKLPLTVINANTEVLEKKHGSDEQLLSINRQVRKMTKLVKNLSALSIFEEKDIAVSKINLSDVLNEVLDKRKESFEKNNIRLEYDIEPEIVLDGDEQALKKVLSELADNALRYAWETASFSLKKQGDRIVLTQKNKTSLPNGSIDQVFDRFTTLENAKGKETDGLGLSYVKDVIKAHNGRVSAKVNSGSFILNIDL